MYETAEGSFLFAKLTETCFSTNTINNHGVDIVTNAGNSDVRGCQDKWNTAFESETLIE